MFIFAALAGVVAGAPPAGQPLFNALTGEFAPCVLRFDGTEPAVFPAWLPGEPVIDAPAGSAEIPIPSGSRQTTALRYVLTVVFNDEGDGGPSVEWRRPDGTYAVISEGLGEAIDDRALGMNSRKLLLPEELTREGGAVVVTYFDRFTALDSVSLRPAREGSVTVSGVRADFSLLDESLRVWQSGEVDGRRHPPLTGDARHGPVVEAELAAAIEEFPEELEFVVPVEGTVEGAMLRLEALGLDPSASLQVELNGAAIGAAGMAVFALDDPSVTRDSSGRLIIAGWRNGSLFLPGRLWIEGENRLLLKLRRPEDDPGKPVFLRNTALHLRFSPTAAETAGPKRKFDFLEPLPIVPHPIETALPQVITSHPKRK